MKKVRQLIEKAKDLLLPRLPAWIPALLFLAAVFLLGKAVGESVVGGKEKSQETVVEAEAAVNVGGKAKHSRQNASDAEFIIVEDAKSWGLGFDKEGGAPTGTATAGELAKYNARYMGDPKEKKIYLTFDCGYENGNTERMLDVLKEQEVSAAFFVVGHFLESAPELVKRMVTEGHTVGNHTYHHPDMSAISDKAAFQKEMDEVSVLFKEVTGQDLPMYYRPPQGKYSTANLQMAKDLGYSTFFWSLAYVDWKEDDQPGREEALEKLTERIHPGAIILLHNTSATNGEILEELLEKWKEMGYTFGKLEELVEK